MATGQGAKETAGCPRARPNRRLRALLAAPLLVASVLPAQTPDQDEPSATTPTYPTAASAEVRADPVYERLQRLMSGKPRARKKAAAALAGSEPAALIPLVDAYFFLSAETRPDALQLLESLSGEQLGSRYRDWFTYVGSRTDLEAPAGYVGWKGRVFSRIDPVYRRILGPDATVRLRLREVQWGGVPLDGIPAIDDPQAVSADAVRFMRDTDTVFGVRIGGEHRAYPVKVLGWHELLNDTVGGEPVTLSFCTLCGSGVLYAAVDESGNRLMFGTSGLLYRSNKLMFDRASLSLWSNLTGEAVVGPKAAEGATLTMLPMTLTRWDVWRQRHPDTSVMVPDPAVAQRTGYRYVEGAADAARAGVEFPVWRQSDALERNARIYALHIAGEAKAYPLAKLRAERLVNDSLGGLDIVLVVDPASEAVRAYERGGLTFHPPDQTPLRQIHAADGSSWWIGEEGLAREGGRGGVEFLPRVPGHVAFWFGWYAFYPDTAVY